MDLSLNLAIFTIGVIFGSFVSVIIYRVPKNISIFYPPSSCVICNERLKWYENMPIIKTGAIPIKSVRLVIFPRRLFE